jgi:hypothetical protein
MNKKIITLSELLDSEFHLNESEFNFTSKVSFKKCKNENSCQKGNCTCNTSENDDFFVFIEDYIDQNLSAINERIDVIELDNENTILTLIDTRVPIILEGYNFVLDSELQTAVTDLTTYINAEDLILSNTITSNYQFLNTKIDDAIISLTNLINAEVLVLNTSFVDLQNSVTNSINTLSSNLGNVENINIIAGNGITGGGLLSSNITLTLGTPSSITDNSINSVTSTSHTHELANNSVVASKIADNAVVNSKILNASVTNVKLSNVSTNTLKGRITASTGVVEDLNPTQVRTLLNIEDGANNYIHPTGFTNHPASALTGTNVISRILVNSNGHVIGVDTKDLIYPLYAPGIGININSDVISISDIVVRTNTEQVLTGLKRIRTGAAGVENLHISFEYLDNNGEDYNLRLFNNGTGNNVRWYFKQKVTLDTVGGNDILEVPVLGFRNGITLVGTDIYPSELGVSTYFNNQTPPFVRHPITLYNEGILYSRNGIKTLSALDDSFNSPTWFLGTAIIHVGSETPTHNIHVRINGVVYKILAIENFI